MPAEPHAMDYCTPLYLLGPRTAGTHTKLQLPLNPVAAMDFFSPDPGSSFSSELETPLLRMRAMEILLATGKGGTERDMQMSTTEKK